MRSVWIIMRRELAGYFATPLALVFLVVFLVLAGAFTFYFGNFYERNQADLDPFFRFHPWLYLFLMPALSMRLWAEERRSGTLELLMTLPVTLPQMVLGKFFAAAAFAGLALALTLPIWITVNYLGDPDNGAIAAGYLGSFLLASAYLAIGSCLSAATRNQVIAFILTVAVCLLFLLAGLPMVLNALQGWAPQSVVETVSSFSFLEHYAAIAKGVLDIRDLVFFISLIAVWLAATAVVLDMKKAN